jgi:hypothetical protein
MSVKVFISYRREDSAGYTGRIYDRLKKVFGEEQLFIDVDAIKGGDDFEQAIQNELDSACALLAIIGPNWLNIADERGNRRLDDPEDYVRLEIATALKRDIRVIPILIGNATPPSEQDLPEDLRLLSKRNVLRIRHESFTADCNQLIGTLPDSLDRKPHFDRLSTRLSEWWSFIWISLAGTLILSILIALILQRQTGKLETRHIVTILIFSFGFVYSARWVWQTVTIKRRTNE